MEFTNGNNYLTDILEIAVVAEESGNIYHRYGKIHYSVPKQVQLLTGIRNRTIETLGFHLETWRMDLLRLFYAKQRKPAIIISLAILAELVYVDIMQNLEDAGYGRPGLEALCEEHKIERRGRSALGDVKILYRPSAL